MVQLNIIFAHTISPLIAPLALREWGGTVQLTGGEYGNTYLFW